MPISNPCKWFVTGGGYDDQKSFTYKPGSKLYHFSPHDSGLSGTMEMNIVLFANDEEHAKQILTDMLQFRIKCLETYKKKTGKSHYGGFSKDGFPEMLLQNKDKWVMIPAPMNQIYKVGWASNDTIL